jgi:hypothetical protein
LNRTRNSGHLQLLAAGVESDGYGMRMRPRFLTIPIAVGVLFFATAVGAVAQTPPTNPYTGTGYDVSWPNSCSATVSGAAFGIVGVNHGRPFTFNNTNNCFSTQYSDAAKTGSASVYINTAYSGAYKKNVTTACSSLVSGTGLIGSYAQAWEIGCSEAETSFDAAGTTTAVMWWLDVETGNSWSSSNFTLNDDTIRGAADRLHGLTGTPVGVYSTSSSWYTITRNANLYSSKTIDGEWDAGASACPASGTIGFTGAPIWLEQTGQTGIDSDTAC